jgi:hypothetical protein
MQKFLTAVALCGLWPGLSAVAREPAPPRSLVRQLDHQVRSAVGYQRADNAPADLQMVAAGPSDEDVAKAVLKALGALVAHEASKPQPGDKFEDMLARAVSRGARDLLIESAVGDLMPGSAPVEIAAVRNLAIQALDGRLPRNRDRVLAELRRINPDMAQKVEMTEFLIQLSQAVERSNR